MISGFFVTQYQLVSMLNLVPITLVFEIDR